MEKLKIERMNGMTEEELNKVVKVDIQLDIDKLNRIYDLEKELGIPLEVLFKALKEGIYRLYEEFEDDEPPYIYYLDPIIMYDEWRECWIFYDESKCQVYCLKDYGKTWWLEKPKEEKD